MTSDGQLDVDDLFLLAESQSWQDRSRAGQGLVAHIGEPTVDAVVLRLMLDPRDTAVTTATADALLVRGDLPSWQIFARGWAVAAKIPTETNQIDHLVSCLNGAMYAASSNFEKAESYVIWYSKACDGSLGQTGGAATFPISGVQGDVWARSPE